MARDGFMPSPNHGPAAREGRLLVVHTAEGARTATALGAWFAQKAAKSSSHDGVDGSQQIGYVHYPQQSWTVRGGNPISENVELCGFAKWTRAQWLSTGVVDQVTNPRAMLRRCSQWLAERSKANNIPLRKLTPAQVKAGMNGVIGHADWTVGMRDGTHTDPGEGFPWDVVIADARKFADTNDVEEDMTPDDLLNTVIRREGLPDGHPLAGKEVEVRQIFAWYDANHNALQDQVRALQATVDRIAARPDAQIVVDGKMVAASVKAAIPDITKAVADEVSRRMAE